MSFCQASTCFTTVRNLQKLARSLHVSRPLRSSKAELSVPQIFDRHVVRLHRDRSAYLSLTSGEPREKYDYLFDEVANRLVERLEDLIERRFPLAVDIGARSGHIAKQLAQRSVGGIEKLIQYDISERLLMRDKDPDSNGKIIFERMVGDEEQPLKGVSPESVDLVMSCLSLHWANDLPGALIQIRNLLKPDGFFCGAMLGEDTLHELKVAFSSAEQEVEGGVSPRVSPFAGVRDCGNLMTRAAFSMPTVDSDTFVIEYESMWELMQHLQRMGETNAVITRRPYIRRDTLAAAEAKYKAMFPSESGKGIQATFQVVYMAGWSPHKSHQQPKQRGSAKVSFKDVEAEFKKEFSMKPLTESDGIDEHDDGVTSWPPPKR